MMISKYILLIVALIGCLPLKADDSRVVIIRTGEMGNTGSNLDVSVTPQGNMRVLRYPLQWKASLEVLQVPTASIVSEISSTSCGSVSQLLNGGGSNPPPAYQKRLDDVRRRTPVLVKLDLASGFQENLIADEVRKAFELKKLPIPNVLHLVNPLSLSELNIALMPGVKSLVSVVGELPELEEKIRRLIDEGIANVGVAQGEITALDLLCDLRLNRIKFSMRVKGDELGSPRYRDLIAASDALSLIDHLKHYSESFRPFRDQENYGRNRILATSLSSRFLISKNLLLDLEDMVTLVQRLTRQDNGVPLSNALSVSEVEELMKIRISDRTPFEGGAEVEFKEKKEDL